MCPAISSDLNPYKADHETVLPDCQGLGSHSPLSPLLESPEPFSQALLALVDVHAQETQEPFACKSLLSGQQPRVCQISPLDLGVREARRRFANACLAFALSCDGDEDASPTSCETNPTVSVGSGCAIFGGLPHLYSIAVTVSAAVACQGTRQNVTRSIILAQSTEQYGWLP